MKFHIYRFNKWKVNFNPAYFLDNFHYPVSFLANSKKICIIQHHQIKCSHLVSYFNLDQLLLVKLTNESLLKRDPLSMISTATVNSSWKISGKKLQIEAKKQRPKNCLNLLSEFVCQVCHCGIVWLRIV